MIPKKIFYVWGYNEPKSRLTNICLENWRLMLPSYDIIEINERSREFFNFDYEYTNNLWFKTVYDLKMWAYVSDYMRVKTICDHGGIYLDTDITIYKVLDDLLSNKMFIGNCLNNIPELAIFGSESQHPFLKKMIDFYQKDIWESSEYIITKIFFNLLTNEYKIFPNMKSIVIHDKISIYPAEYFHPFHYSQEFNNNCITENTYSVHWMGASWHSKVNFYFLANKNRIPLKTLLKQLEFLKKHTH